MSEADFGAVMTVPQRAVFRFGRAVVWALSKVLFRIEVHGGEHVPKDGSFILSPVHRSYLDMPLTVLVTRRIMRYMGKETLWNNWFGAFFLTSMGGFPVQRGTADREALRACKVVLDRGEGLVMFPEGTRQEGAIVDPELMHDGPAFMSGRAQVPIVPLGIGGSDRAMPPGQSLVFPRKIVLVVGPPLAPPAQTNGRVPRRLIREKTEELRQAVQAVYDEAQSRVG